MPPGIAPLTGRDAALDAALQRGALLLTPNQRSARAWHARFDAARRAEGLSAWRPAEILPWRAWIARTWSTQQIAGAEDRVLLSGAQELVLWEATIASSTGVMPALRRPLARMCAGAERLLADFDVAQRYRQDRSAATQDAQNFHDWRGRVWSRLQRERLLPAAWADQEIAAEIAGGQIPLPGEVVLWGFTRLLPAQRQLIAAMEAAGVKVEVIAAVREAPEPPRLLQCSDESDETALCSQWLARSLEPASEQMIALIVPDLDACRAPLERTLRATLAPWAEDVTAPTVALPYEFSTGQPLLQMPAVRDALLLLRWCAGDISVDEVGALLRSAHLQLAESPDTGAELHAFCLGDIPSLRQSLGLQETGAALRQWLGSKTRLRSAVLETLTRLKPLEQAAAKLSRRPQEFSAWVEAARTLLEAAGWPGEGALRSVEFQVVDRWNEVLEGVAALDVVAAKVSFADFVQALARETADTQFAPENTGAPVQVMTPAEAAGTTAETMWFLHADDERWNGQRVAHPMLSITLQRALGMPGVDVERDEAQAFAETERLANSAAWVVFSFAAHRADAAQLPSPLVERVNNLQRETAATPTPNDEVAEDVLEFVHELGTVPPLAPGVIAGGAEILTAQAQCGFRAFAEKRLYSTGVEPGEPGYSPVERGNLVHAVLESFWKQMRSHAALVEQSEVSAPGEMSQRDLLLKQCVAAAIAKAEGDDGPRHPWEVAQREAQSARLFRLINEWLKLEAERPPFTVEAIEAEVERAVVGPLHLRLRVDRIDALGGSGNEHLLIDYKTGRDELNGWEGERMDAPQLPLYAITAGDGSVSGIALGKVKQPEKDRWLRGRGDVHQFAVKASRASVGQDAKGPSFDALMQQWRADLVQLAEDFAGGAASLDPKEYPKTCDYCEQRLLCRLNPRSFYVDDDAEHGAEDDGL